MRTLEIYINGVSDLLNKEGVYAECDYSPYYHKNPREFIIRVDNAMSDHLFLKTIMHEMVHVKQFAKGEFKQLVSFGTDVFRWQQSRIDVTKIEYWDYPWEIEAHGREIGLVYQFCCKNEEYFDLCKD